MEKLLALTALMMIALNVAYAAPMKLQSSKFVENSKGEILEDGIVVNSKGKRVRNSEPALAVMKNSQETFVSVRHVLIPETPEVRAVLLKTRGNINIEGNILGETIETKGNTTVKLIKVLVRDIKR